MNQLSHLEYEINGMKADTLSVYGKRVEHAQEMLEKYRRLHARYVKIHERMHRELKSAKKRRIRKKIQQSHDKMIGKRKRTEEKIRQLIKLRDTFLDEYKHQREALGMIDHSFVDDFYADK